MGVTVTLGFSVQDGCAISTLERIEGCVVESGSMWIRRGNRIEGEETSKDFQSIP
jgi:hypothetical protein